VAITCAQIIPDCAKLTRGSETSPNFRTFFVPLDLRTNFQQCVGAEHSMLLSDIGEVYSFGSNSYGQLGLGDLTNTAIPHKIVQLMAVTKIACGTYHSTALCGTVDLHARVTNAKSLNCLDKGLWVWGKGNEGQLGVLDTMKQVTPVLIEDFRPKLIRRLYCGFEHTLIVNYPTKGEFRSKFVRDLLEVSEGQLICINLTLDRRNKTTWLRCTWCQDISWIQSTTKNAHRTSSTRQMQ
jgi:alpha-tubulin suppressor-like RCC1 family protein